VAKLKKKESRPHNDNILNAVSGLGTNTLMNLAHILTFKAACEIFTIDYVKNVLKTSGQTAKETTIMCGHWSAFSCYLDENNELSSCTSFLLFSKWVINTKVLTHYNSSTLILHSDFTPCNSHPWYTSPADCMAGEFSCRSQHMSRKRFAVTHFDTVNNFARYLQHRSNSTKVRVRHLFRSLMN